MFRRIQNESLKKECILVRIRGAFLAEKGAPKLNFYREGGGSCPHLPPPKSATGTHNETVKKLTLFSAIINVIIMESRLKSLSIGNVINSSLESLTLSHLHRNNSNSNISQSDWYSRNRRVLA